MLNKNFSFRALSTAANDRGIVGSIVMVALCLTFTGIAFAGTAEDIKDASRLYQQGKLDVALTKVNAALVQQPKDAQGRFVKGLILTEQKKTADAIQVFSGLTEDFPELPEPYNNLAVLYASQGNYDKAKAALELAIHTHPSYATAHENLGDIYAQLARRAYDKALQLDKNNTAAQSKLAMVKDLFASPKTVALAALDSQKTSPPATPPVAVASANTKPAASAATAVTSTTAPSKVEPAKPSATAPAADANDVVANTITAWAEAWATKNVSAYLGFYDASFETPHGLTRGKWESQRRKRITAPATISVNIKMIKVSTTGNEAVASFRQTYRSDKTTSNNTKTLRLVKSGERWLIRSERAGG